MKKIKAIQTGYKGYHFRSRLEARYAVFFDALGLEWEYEVEGYDLGDAGYYLPDFFLPEHNSWIEIKGNKASDSDIEKCKQLFLGSGGDIQPSDLVALGDMKVTWDIFSKISEMCGAGASIDKKQNELSEVVRRARRAKKVYLFEGLLENGWLMLNKGCAQVYPPNALWFLIGGSKDAIEIAFKKARSARFEHGHKGATL